MKKKLIFEEYIAAAVLLIMVVLAMVNVVSRVLIGFSFAYTEELIVYLFVVTSMFGISAGVYRGVHMSLTLVADMFKGRGKLVFIIAGAVSGIALFFILGWQSLKLMNQQMKYSYLTPVMQIPTWVFTVSMIVGSVTYVFRTVQATIRECGEVLRPGTAGAEEKPADSEGA